MRSWHRCVQRSGREQAHGLLKQKHSAHNEQKPQPTGDRKGNALVAKRYDKIDTASTHIVRHGGFYQHGVHNAIDVGVLPAAHVSPRAGEVLVHAYSFRAPTDLRWVPGALVVARGIGEIIRIIAGRPTKALRRVKSEGGMVWPGQRIHWLVNCSNVGGLTGMCEGNLRLNRSFLPSTTEQVQCRGADERFDCR